MQTLSLQELQRLSEEFTNYAQKNQAQVADDSLKPLLNSKCSFSKLDKLGNLIGNKSKQNPVDVVKGIRWGIKTIGRIYPKVEVPFLIEQLKAKKKLSKLMLRKALKYLPEDKKAEVLAYV